MNPTNITPNTANPSTLQNTMQTQPSAVISSDLATNVTNKNLDELAREESVAKFRLEQRAVKDQQTAELSAKNKPVPTSAVDGQISDALGNPAQRVDLVQQETDKRVNSVKLGIANLIDQVDPHTATLLKDLENLVLTS